MGEMKISINQGTLHGMLGSVEEKSRNNTQNLKMN